MMNRKRLLAACLLLVAGTLIGAATYRPIAIHLATPKHKITSRGAAALAANSVFWHTFHGAQYDGIQNAIEALTRVYLATPNDQVTAARLAWLHMWRISERTRLDSAPATITEDMLVSRRYFEEAVRLDESDPRTLGFLASARMGEGAIEGDERLQRTGYFTMRDAIKAWPAFNLFTAGYVESGLPRASSHFREALEWEWRDLDVCTSVHVDRRNPDLTQLIDKVKDRRACLDTWIAPHNGEGFFLNMGDMLVKSGDWQTARKIYANAKLLPAYSKWPFAALLEERIQNAPANVARFNGYDPDPRTGMMGNSAFSCMACHQQ